MAIVNSIHLRYVNPTILSNPYSIKRLKVTTSGAFDELMNKSNRNKLRPHQFSQLSSLWLPSAQRSYRDDVVIS